jgi:hypothetical protein
MVSDLAGGVPFSKYVFFEGEHVDIPIEIQIKKESYPSQAPEMHGSITPTIETVWWRSLPGVCR